MGGVADGQCWVGFRFPGAEHVPHLDGLRIELIRAAGSTVRIEAATGGDPVGCPECGTMSGRVDSRYQQRLSDTSITSREVVIRLQVRGLFCDNSECSETTFAEQVGSTPTGPGALCTEAWDRGGFHVNTVDRPVEPTSGTAPGHSPGRGIWEELFSDHLLGCRSGLRHFVIPSGGPADCTGFSSPPEGMVDLASGAVHLPGQPDISSPTTATIYRILHNVYILRYRVSYFPVDVFCTPHLE
ncbi:transposase family protein [Nocardia sp. NPDC023852]|uniref:transposase family protein n=1 Tax=Nocardia sp. NPDC023852 TaxID=3154697 RepID=UPI0033CA87C2